MKFSKWIKGLEKKVGVLKKTSHAFLARLEKKKVISRWPPTWVPFVLVVIIFVEGFFFPLEEFRTLLYFLAGFAFLFAIVHWFVVRTLNRES